MSREKIARARAIARRMTEGHSAPTPSEDYSRLTPFQLIRLAERPEPLSSAELEALDFAWRDRFGEWLCEPDGPSDAEAGPIAPIEQLPDDDTMLSMAEMERVTGLSKSTIKRRVQDDRAFPQPVKPSARRIGWKALEVKDWLQTLERRRRSA